MKYWEELTTRSLPPISRVIDCFRYIERHFVVSAELGRVGCAFRYCFGKCGAPAFKAVACACYCFGYQICHCCTVKYIYIVYGAVKVAAYRAFELNCVPQAFVLLESCRDYCIAFYYSVYGIPTYELVAVLSYRFGIYQACDFRAVVYCQLGGAAQAAVAFCYEGYRVLVDFVERGYCGSFCDIVEALIPTGEGVTFAYRVCRCCSACSVFYFFCLQFRTVVVYECYGVLIDFVECGYGGVFCDIVKALIPAGEGVAFAYSK